MIDLKEHAAKAGELIDRARILTRFRPKIGDDQTTRVRALEDLVEELIVFVINEATVTRESLKLTSLGIGLF